MAGYPESKEGPPGDGMIADGLADILAVPSHRAARWRAFPALDARFPEEPTWAFPGVDALSPEEGVRGATEQKTGLKKYVFSRMTL